MPPCLPGSAKSAANTAKTVTITGITGKKICLSHLIVAIAEAAVGASAVAVTVSDGSTVILEAEIPASTAISTPIQYTFDSPLQATLAIDMVITVGACGNLSKSIINYGYYTQ